MLKRPAVVDLARYTVVIEGFMEQPLTLTLVEVKHMPHTSIAAFHKCYGSPLKPSIGSILTDRQCTLD
jgi:DMSO/TMAO reductase YedYZ molybdopterin-dependent catalytic subunit